jgi:hypothetical protein
VEEGAASTRTRNRYTLAQRKGGEELGNLGILQKIANELPVGTRLDPNYLVTGVRASRGECALFYSIPNKTTGKRSQKTIVESEFEMAYRHLQDEGEFTLPWFKKNMPMTASQSTSCSFKVVGEIFVFLGLARRVSAGRGHKYAQSTAGHSIASHPSAID